MKMGLLGSYMSIDILDLPPPVADSRIAYGDDPLQFGDLRLPEGAGPFPLAIVVHGGYWRARYDLAYFGHCCAALASCGVATWNIEYRRLGNPGGGWPGIFQDVGRAADYARALEERYPVDLRRVAAIGHSAGGHLALWLAGRHRLPAGSVVGAPDPLPIRAVVALAPVADLRMADELQLSAGVTAQLMGGSPEERPERYAQGSPAELLPLGARQIIVHGADDTAVPYSVGSSYTERAQAAGDNVELVTLPGTGHFEIVDPRTRQWAQIEALVLRELVDRGP
jgi:acetyl esterase/lipase